MLRADTQFRLIASALLCKRFRQRLQAKLIADFLPVRRICRRCQTVLQKILIPSVLQMRKQTALSTVRHRIVPVSHIDRKDQKRVACQRPDHAAVFPSTLVQDAKQFFLVIQLRLFPAFLQMFLLFFITGAHHAPENLIVRADTSCLQKIRQFILQCRIPLQKFDQFLTVQCAFSQAEFFQALRKILCRTVASPNEIRRCVQTVTDPKNLNQHPIRTRTVVKVLRIAHFSIPGLVVPQYHITVFLHRRDFFKYLRSSLRMFINPLFFTACKAARLLVDNLRDLKLSDIEQLCRLFHKIEKFLRLLQHLHHACTAKCTDQQLRLLFQNHIQNPVRNFIYHGRMDQRNLIAVHQNIRQNLRAFLIVREHFQKSAQRTVHHIVDKCCVSRTRHSSQYLNVLIDTFLYQIRITLILFFVIFQAVNNVRQVIDRHLKQTAVREISVLLIHRIMLHAVIAEPLIVLHKLCERHFSGEKKIPVVIAVNLIRHLIRLASLIEITLVISSELFSRPLQKLRIDRVPLTRNHIVAKQIITQLLHDLLKIKAATIKRYHSFIRIKRNRTLHFFQDPFRPDHPEIEQHNRIIIIRIENPFPHLKIFDLKVPAAQLLQLPIALCTPFSVLHA